MAISVSLASRMQLIDASGIRRVFEMAGKMDNPINLSIGQPDFEVPLPIREQAINSIRAGRNGYTITQGIVELRRRIAEELQHETGRPAPPVLVTSGVSGGLLLAVMAMCGPGDEVIVPDPFFVMYKALVNLSGAKPVFVSTYPDFRLRADAVAAALTARTKLILLNSPANPTGAVASAGDLRAVLDLARQHGILVLSDEIYDRFSYDSPFESALRLDPDNGANVLVVRGFSKTYAMTGWRLGYATGPKELVNAMAMLQQYSFVCAPSMAQYAGVTALDTDVSPQVAELKAKRDFMRARLAGHFRIEGGQGAFYLFPEAPGGSGTAFCEAAFAEKLLIIPGSVFSERDTHFRLSYATDFATLERGAEVLCRLAAKFSGSRV